MDLVRPTAEQAGGGESEEPNVSGCVRVTLSLAQRENVRHLYYDPARSSQNLKHMAAKVAVYGEKNESENDRCPRLKYYKSARCPRHALELVKCLAGDIRGGR